MSELENYTVELTAELSVDLELSGSLAPALELIGELDRDGSVEYYTGDYEVTPTSEEITLPTGNKILNWDVTVHQIPYFEVFNPSGGHTVIIGG